MRCLVLLLLTLRASSWGYGAKVGRSATKELCRDPRVDAVFNTCDGTTYVLKDDKSYHLTDVGWEVEPISEAWPGLPNNIDAAFTYRNGKTFFFKGEEYWRFSQDSMDEDYPRMIGEGFRGIPDDLDAAVEWASSGSVYFFKGEHFWEFVPGQNPAVTKDHPKPLSLWKGLPTQLDAALVCRGTTYFFKGRHFYRFNDTTFSVVNAVPAYPRAIADSWFGCKGQSEPHTVWTSTTAATTTTEATPSVRPHPYVRSFVKDPTTSTTSTTTTTTTTTTPRPRVRTTIPTPKTTTTTTTEPPSPPQGTTVTFPRRRPAKARLSKENLVLCRDPTIDTIFSTQEGEIVVFKGNMYYKLKDDGIQHGPRYIHRVWADLPARIDAAFSYKDGSIYFIKGSHVWRYRGTELDTGYPKPIKEVFPGIPNNIDAAMQWGVNGKVYFFKGKLFWKWDETMENEPYPRLIANWAGIPNYVDAATVIQGHTYFFKGQKYYRFDDQSFAVDIGYPPYPRPTGEWWFGCPEGTARPPPIEPAVRIVRPTNKTAPEHYQSGGGGNKSLQIMNQYVAVLNTTRPPTTTTTTKRTTTTTTTTTPRPTTTTRRPTTTTRRPRTTSLCADPTVDTMFTLDGAVYVFKGEKYFRLGASGIEREFPRAISSTWSDLPGNIDAAFTDQRGRTYFFKGTKCWKYYGRRKERGYPRLIRDEFPGVPDNIDTALLWEANNKIYFFKGKWFWKWDQDMAPYPRLIANWAGIPNYLNAAFVYERKTYFVKGNKYFRFDDASFAVDRGDPPYPRSTKAWWFGCGDDYKGR